MRAAGQHQLLPPGPALEAAAGTIPQQARESQTDLVQAILTLLVVRTTVVGVYEQRRDQRRIRAYQPSDSRESFFESRCLRKQGEGISSLILAFTCALGVGVTEVASSPSRRTGSPPSIVAGL